MKTFDIWFAHNPDASMEDAFEAGRKSMVPIKSCKHEWQGGRNSNTTMVCVRPKGHRGAHATYMFPEDTKGL